MTRCLRAFSRRANIAVALGLAAIAAAQRPAVFDLPDRPPAGCRIAPASSAGFVATNSAWPGGVVPFRYAANVTPAMQSAMAAAMQEITSRVRVTFVPFSTQSDFVVIRDSTINSSPIGRVGGGQFLDIANWNLRFEMVHGLMHVLGCWHEHQRPDRDQFVQIQTANVDPARQLDFQLVPVGNTLGLAYDLDSVMHFSASEGSINGASTIVVLPPNQSQQTTIGQRTHLSVSDQEQLRLVYGSLAPPTIAAITPNSAPSWLPPALIVTGALLDEVTAMRLDNQTMTFQRQSATQIRANLPQLPTIGPHLITVVSAAGTSQGFPFTVTANDPPVLFGPVSASRFIALPFRVFTDATRLNVVLVSTDNLPSSAPGVIALGIGNQFANLGEVASGVGNASGDLLLNLRAPASMPAGLRLYLQSYVFDPTNPQLPVSTSNVLAITVL